MTSSTKAEIRLKAAVVDRLFAGAHVDANSVLVSEMVVDNWTRRADLVLANGRLWAFELKSASDKLARLPGQVETFSRFFEKFVVVVASRFEQAARSMLSEGVGLWVEEDGIITERVRPKALPLAKEAAISLMTATELRRLLVCNGVDDIRYAPREKLAGLAKGLPAPDLANAARDSVKRRHHTRYLDFIRVREAAGSISAIASLKRSPRSGPIVAAAEASAYLPAIEVPQDHPELFQAPAGPVLKRRLA